MFPPVMTQAILPDSLLLLERAEATDDAPAPSATIRFDSASNLMASAISRVVQTIVSSITLLATAHTGGRHPRPPIPSQKLAVYRQDTALPAFRHS